MLVTDGIHLIDGVKGAHAYLVTGAHTFLVDSGVPGQDKRILRYLAGIGLEPSALEGIVLTHYDIDHVGSAVKLQEAASCPIYSHFLEIPYILGEKKRPGIKYLLPYLTRPVYGALVNPKAVSPLPEGSFLEEWEVIPTPGHTPGHVVLYRNGIAIVGDLFQGGQIRPAPKHFTWDMEAMKVSARKVLERPLRWILPGHGDPTPASNHWLDQLMRTM